MKKILSFFAFALFTFSTSFAQVDRTTLNEPAGFLKLGDIKGEFMGAKIQNKEGVEINMFNNNSNLENLPARGTVVIKVDKTSDLARSLRQAKGKKNRVMYLEGDGYTDAGRVTYLKYKLSKVRVTRFDTSDNPNSTEFSLNYTTIEFE